MRFLFLASRDWTHPQATGGDAHTCDYARYLAARGHDVTLLAARYPGSHALVRMEGVRIIRPGGLFFLAARALVHYLSHRNDYDVVYEEGMASVRIPFCAPLYVRKPLIAIWYQVNATIFREQYPPLVARLMTLVERLLLRLHRNCVLVTSSAEQRDALIRSGLHPERVRLAPPLMLDSEPAPPDLPRQRMIVWLGKLRRYKCAHHAIEAMPDVIARVPDARLVIAGRRDDGRYEEELRSLAKRLGVGDRVDFALDLSDAQKWELLASARALVVTSPLEGFGIVIVEANRCGTPAIVTAGVPEETARDGYNALTVPFGDTHALVQAITELLGNEEVFETMSQAARLHGEGFSSAESGRQFESALECAVSRAA